MGVVPHACAHNIYGPNTWGQCQKHATPQAPGEALGSLGVVAAEDAAPKTAGGKHHDCGTEAAVEGRP